MKQGIHPTYYPEATVICACGNTWHTGSTTEVIHTDVCSNCHPFYTGEQRIVDAEGQVDRFYRKLEARQEYLEGARERLAARPTPRWAFRWPSLAMAASLVLALGVAGYQAGVVVPRMESQLDAYRSVRQVPSFFLSVSRSEPQTVSLTRQDREVVLALSRSSIQSFASYECELTDGGGKALSRSRLPAPPQAEELQVLVPTLGLSPGPYILRLSGLETGGLAPIEVARYHFVLRFEGEEVKR